MLHFLIARLQTVEPLHDFQTCHHQNLKPDCHPHLHNHDRSEHKKRKEKTTPFGVNLMRSQVLYQAAQIRKQYHLLCMKVVHNADC